MKPGDAEDGGQETSRPGAPRVLLLVPARTYRAADFLTAAARLGLDLVIGSDGALPLGSIPVVRADMRGPVGSRLAEEVTSLVESADAFHDGIDLDARADDLTRNGFAGVAAASDTVANELAGIR